jgi:DNA-binding CsgD family transcriptional regulator
MNESKENEILQELQRISKLLALTVTRELKQQQEKVELLSGVGFRPIEIANITGIEANQVSAVLSNIKKKAQTGKGKSTKTSKEVKSSDEQATS